MDIERINSYCDSCKNKLTCLHPCRPVDEYINQDSKRPFIEKNFPNMIISLPTTVEGNRDGEYRFCDLHDNSNGMPFDVNQVEDVVPDDLFDFPPGEKQVKAKVFYKCFFERKDYKTVADELDLKEHSIPSLYYDAKKSIRKIMKYLDSRKSAARFVSHSKLKQEQIWFILVNVFGLSAKDVADLWPKKVGVEWIRRNVGIIKKDYLNGRVEVHES